MTSTESAAAPVPRMKPRNMAPYVQQPLPPLSAVAGKPFSEWVPAETFMDFEDGETPDLELELVEPSAEGQRPPADGWLQFSSGDQHFYGL